MASTPRIVDIERVVHGNKVNNDFIAAPYTQIKNEHDEARQIPDLENNLKASLGNERIVFYSIKKLDKEFGPNGEPVHELNTKDARVRFVGDWISTNASAHGTYIQASDSGTDYIEVTFYGTGLNLLQMFNANDRDIRVTIDGGAEGSDIYTAAYSSITSGRNYKTNQALPIVNNLSLGVHTVKIRSAQPIAGAYIHAYGVEILNESTQLTVNAGNTFVGGQNNNNLSTQTLLDYKPTSLTGTKGGRVVTYLDEDGNLGQATQAVDVTPQYLGSTDHSNEEIYRTINFREFGANRADDFSTLAGVSDRAFTLDDGTTTLVGDNVVAVNEGVYASQTNHFITLTFVGVGLGVYCGREDASVPNQDYEVIVDGISMGLTTFSNGDTSNATFKVCSGLPYGTHTVKLKRNDNVGSTQYFRDFIIYQPKKPALPENIFELADYNVMADYVANTVQHESNIATGVLRKSQNRESIYVGSWNIGGVDINRIDGVGGCSTDTLTNYQERVFWGSGIELRSWMQTGLGGTATISIDGSTDLSGFTTSTAGAGIGLTPATGVLDNEPTSSGRGFGVEISGMTLGWHTVRITHTSGTRLHSMVMDVITPIHINNTKVGSLSLEDKREDRVSEESSKNIDWSKAKAWLVYDQVANKILESHNISSVLDVSIGNNRIYFKRPFKTKYMVACGLALTGTGKHLNIFDSYPSYVALIRVNDGGGAEDGHYSIAFFGELEDEENIDLTEL